MTSPDSSAYARWARLTTSSSICSPGSISLCRKRADVERIQELVAAHAPWLRLRYAF